MKKLLVASAIGLMAVVQVSVAQPQLITFDGLPGDGSTIPNGYGGFNWDNFYDVNGAAYAPLSGYANGAVSPPNVAYNGYGNPASWMSSLTPFTLNSAYITAAWNDGLNVNVEGLNALNQVLYNNNYTVNTEGPTLITFNYVGINEVLFTTSGGVNMGLGGSGEHLALDNVTVNAAVIAAVPEPTPMISVALLLLPVGWSAVRHLRKKLPAV
jgi:hypothetical protein